MQQPRPKLTVSFWVLLSAFAITVIFSGAEQWTSHRDNVTALISH